MNKIKINTKVSILILLSAITAAVLFSSCTSLKTTFSPKPKLTKYENSLFWKIDGKDAEGNPSEVYILGTIHEGDDRLYPLPEEIQSAWNKANRIAGEIASEEYQLYDRLLAQKVDDSLIPDSGDITGKSVIDELTDEELDLVILLFGMEGAASLSYYQPWVMSSSLDSSIFMSEDNPLSTNKSYDFYFMMEAAKNGINIEGLDTLQDQIDLLAYGDWDFQVRMLKDKLAEIVSGTAASDIMELYNAYLTCNADLIAQTYFSSYEKDIEEYPPYKDYYNALLYERNRKWADKIEDYLLQGGTTFIFAGCGHFIGENSVFSYMRLK